MSEIFRLIVAQAPTFAVTAARNVVQNLVPVSVPVAVAVRTPCAAWARRPVEAKRTSTPPATCIDHTNTAAHSTARMGAAIFCIASMLYIPRATIQVCAPTNPANVAITKGPGDVDTATADTLTAPPPDNPNAVATVDTVRPGQSPVGTTTIS